MTTLNTRKRVQLKFKKPSLTKQYFQDECDINNIVQKFSETGQISNLNNMDPQYGESPNMDLKEALDLVDNLRNEFDSLSKEEKASFGHNMNNYAQFLSDYEESPQSFTNQQTPQHGTTIPENQKTDESTALGSPDEGRRSET